MDLTFPTPSEMFNVRVAVAIVHDGRLLVQGDHHYPFVVPPGGRCRLHESTADAARREIREELACDVAIGRLLWLVENFFELDGRRVHELTFVYEGRLPADAPFVATEGDFLGAEDNPRLFYRWVPLPELATLELYPEVLRGAADGFPASTERVVVRTS